MRPLAPPSSRRDLQARLGPCLLLSLLAGCGSSDPARCHSVRGISRVSLALMNCDSPLMQCTAGLLTQTGLIDGETRFVGEKLAPSAGLGDAQPTVASYSGTLTVRGPSGALVLAEVGVLDFAYPGGLFVSRDLIISGTGAFSGAQGYLLFRGTGTTSFVSEVSGEVCLAP